MEQTFMKEKKILPLVLSMSLPMVISMAVNSLYNIVDSYFVAKLSEDAMTALALVFPIQNMINAIAIGFAIGINASVAYFLGAGDQTCADKSASQGWFLNLLHGIVLSILCIAIMRPFLRMFSSDETVVKMALSYSNRAFLFSPVIALTLVYEKLFQAVGKMKVSMFCMMCGFIANIILDPLMIFGIGFFPAMGIAGAAYATGIGQLLTLLAYLIFCKTDPIPVKIKRQYLRPEKNVAMKLYSVGLSATLSLALPSLLISVLNGILAAFSGTYVLVLGVYYKLQTFLYLSANGIIQGMRPLIGYNYGAGEQKRVQSIYKVCLLLAAGIMTAGTVLCQAIPSRLMSLFTSNGDTIAAGAFALRIISMGFIISSVSIISCGALEGLSKGLASLVISLLRYVLVTIPAAWGLSRFMGAAGVWHGFSREFDS